MWPFYYKTQIETVKDLLSSGTWIDSQVFVDKGIMDFRTVVYRLRNQGYIIEKHQDREKKGGHDVNKPCSYHLVGRVCPPMREKRGYLDDFTEEELISALWRKGRITNLVANGNTYQIIN